MSSAVVSTSAALGRPFVFDDEAAVGSLASPSRAALDRTAPSTPLRACPEPVEGAGLGGCPHINLPESRLARLQSAISNRQSKISPARVTPASQLGIRPAPEMAPSGIPAIDALTGGLPRGCLTEVCGPASSGRTTLLLAALAAATRRGEFCVLVDASDALDPHSAAAAGVELDRLLWVRCGDDFPGKKSSPQSHPSTPLRAGSATEKNGNQKTGCPISRAPSAREACPEPVERVGISSVRGMGVPPKPTFDFDPNGWRETGSKETGPNENSSRQSEHRLEQVLRATDLLLESGGFGLIVLDLGDLPPQSARRIPLTTWFRFRRAVENKPTILLAIEQKPIAGSCSSLLLQLGDPSAADSCDIGLTHAQLLTGLNITAELIRSRLDRKPARSIAFATKTAWAG